MRRACLFTAAVASTRFLRNKVTRGLTTTIPTDTPLGHSELEGSFELDPKTSDRKRHSYIA